VANFSVEKYKAGLAKIPKAVKTQSYAALDKHAEKMMSAMRRFAGDETGKLDRSIRAEKYPSLLRITLKAGGDLTTKPVREGASKTYDYALAQEFGTSKMSARPYFWPGYRLFRKQARAAVKRAMNKAIKENFGK
jgi:HK97 gp10 family phage protein